MRQTTIVALDVDNAQKARELLSALRGVRACSRYGISCSPPRVLGLFRRSSSGERVFLDLKYHDIPNTVARAGVEATRLGVSIFNLHSAGGSEMMRRTAESVSECAAAEGLSRPLVIAVTILTSANEVAVAEVGFASAPVELVPRLALLAEASGMDRSSSLATRGWYCTLGCETTALWWVTPGVRPAELRPLIRTRNDSPRCNPCRRDYVVGRPILVPRSRPGRSANP